MSLSLFQIDLREQYRADLPYFYPSDTRELYRSNLLRLGSSWQWADQVIEYKLNSQGYRAAEWDQISWDRSLVCFGCSNTFGIGINVEDTWVHQLGQILGVPTVNLGVSGGSIQLLWANSQRMISQGIKPLAVVYFWPDLSRSCEFIEADRAVNWGVWRGLVEQTDQLGSLGTAWMRRPQHARVMTELFLLSLHWSCPWWGWSWSHDLPGVGQLSLTMEEDLDRGRDGRHYGPQSNLAIARWISSRIQL